MSNCSSKSSHRFAPRRAIHAQQLHDRQQVLFHGQLAEDARFLGQVAHAALAGAAIHGPIGHVDAVEIDLAGFRLDHPAGDAEAGCLAGPVGAQQAHDLVVIDVKAHSVHHPPPAIVFHEPHHLQRRLDSRGADGCVGSICSMAGFGDFLCHLPSLPLGGVPIARSVTHRASRRCIKVLENVRFVKAGFSNSQVAMRSHSVVVCWHCHHCAAVHAFGALVFVAPGMAAIGRSLVQSAPPVYCHGGKNAGRLHNPALFVARFDV